MSEEDDLPELSREDAHPRAREALTDAFFWDFADEGSPIGNETGRDTFVAFEEWRDEHPRESPLALLRALLARWEVADAYWDTVDAAEVQAAGEEDEFSLLTRDEVIFGLAFSQLLLEGRVDTEVRRRALLAITRQELPMILSAWEGRALERAQRLARMREILSRKWD
jgi:uncharacterized protein YfeS